MTSRLLCCVFARFFFPPFYSVKWKLQYCLTVLLTCIRGQILNLYYFFKYCSMQILSHGVPAVQVIDYKGGDIPLKWRVNVREMENSLLLCHNRELWLWGLTISFCMSQAANVDISESKWVSYILWLLFCMNDMKLPFLTCCIFSEYLRFIRGAMFVWTL